MDDGCGMVNGNLDYKEGSKRVVPQCIASTFQVLLVFCNIF